MKNRKLDFPFMLKCILATIAVFGVSFHIIAPYLHIQPNNTHDWLVMIIGLIIGSLLGYVKKDTP